MIIIFNVTYPDSIDPAAAKKILQLLPQPKNKNPQLPKDVEEVQLEVFDGKLTRYALFQYFNVQPWLQVKLPGVERRPSTLRITKTKKFILACRAGLSVNKCNPGRYLDS